MILTAYSRYIVRHSFLFLSLIITISTVLTVVPLICHDLPSFSDPLAGFETRGTTLADRMIAWENLIDEIRPSKRLAFNPKDVEDQIRINQTYYNKTGGRDRTRSGQRRPKNKGKKKKKENNYTVHGKLDNTSNEKWDYGRNIQFEDKSTQILRNYTNNQWHTLQAMNSKPDVPFLNTACGPPTPGHARLVVSNTEKSSLLEFGNVKKMCELQSVLINANEKVYQQHCEMPPNPDTNITTCCPAWSIPNYIALLSGRSSCHNVTQEDVERTVGVLELCAGYFHNFTLTSTCSLDACKVPRFCSQYDAIYNLLFYLLDSEAFSPSNYSNSFVKHAIIFLPLARSSTIMPYYDILQSSNLTYGNLFIPAIDFGLRNALFDLWIIQDTWLVGLGGVFVFLGVWMYAKSLLLTLLLFTAITYSLGIAYFVYVYIFNLVFFPFMNLLVVVVVIGIGADDAFLYVKVWDTVKKQLLRDNAVANNTLSDIKNVSSAGETILVQILDESLKHCVVTILITSLTTSVAFLASYVSYIPAINCFSVFAGTTVLVNFFLMVTLLPLSVFIVDVKMCKIKITFIDNIYKNIYKMNQDIIIICNRLIVAFVTKLHVVIVVIFGAIGVYSLVVVFYMPGLNLPESREFQLFLSDHPFEQYDLVYRDKFLFEQFAKGSKMPLRFVWGVSAIDNGNHMDPASTGKLIFSDTFSISHPESQVWLLNFCAKLKAQPFYQHTPGILLPNCFIETFKIYMERPCVDNIFKIDRTPCCHSSTFPYDEEVFEKCINKAIESLYQTPLLVNPGLAGPKFLRATNPPKIAAVVVESESVVPYSMSFKDMDIFYNHVENWTKTELLSAPPGMSGGWFVSDFQFYDLQKTLASGTVIALVLSASLGFLVLLPSTRCIVTSICALISMIFSATVTIAILVLIGWKLNILESVAISTSAGLAVDFSLHFALSYINAVGSKTVRVKQSLSASAGPTAAAALTSGFAGIFLLRSSLLPYSQIGLFLALIMLVSWLYAAFFLCSLLHIFGRDLQSDHAPVERKPGSRISSICSAVPNLESHELEHLAGSNPTNYTHSPSNMSSSTVVIHDDCELPINKMGKLTVTSDND